MRKAVGTEWLVTRDRDCVTPCFCQKGKWIHTHIWHFRIRKRLIGFLNGFLIWFFISRCLVDVKGRAPQGTTGNIPAYLRDPWWDCCRKHWLYRVLRKSGVSVQRDQDFLSSATCWGPSGEGPQAAPAGSSWDLLASPANVLSDNTRRSQGNAFCFCGCIWV